ncbi:unnamed protein product [Closterium sp. NIES-54]
MDELANIWAGRFSCPALQPARCTALPCPAARTPCSPRAAQLAQPCSPHAALPCSPLAAPAACAPPSGSPLAALLLPCLRRPAAAAAAARATAAAGAGGAGPNTDRHCLSWPLSRQLQRLGVDSGCHCLSQTTPPLSSFYFGTTSLATPGARESPAAQGASESAIALGACESAAALGARASPATGPSSAEALHTFTLDSNTSRCFFRDCTSLTPLAAPVPVSLADPTGGQVVARASTVLPYPAVHSGYLSGLHLPTFLTNLVSNAAIQDVWVDNFIPGGQRVAICQVAASSQVSASGQLAMSCSCRVLSHQTLLWHHHLSHPSIPRLHSMHSRLLISRLPRSLPSLPRSPAPPCLSCVEGRQRAALHSSEFPPTIAPLQTLHMDVWGPALVGGTDQERYFLLVVDDYTRYTTVFPLRRKADINGILIPLIHASRRQLRERFSQDFPVLCLHSDRGGDFSSDLLAEFCRDEGICQSFTLPASPQQNGIAEHRIGLIMEVARTSMIHATAPHFLWPFAVRYAVHQLNLWPRVSEPETSPTLRWTRKVGDASMFGVWGALSLVRDAKVSKLSSRTLRCGPARSGVSRVDPPPLVEPLEISSDSSGPVEGGDPAADDTAATRCSPHLETPPGFPPLPSSPPPQHAAVDSGAETAGAEPGGAETEGEGSGGAASGGAATGGAATTGAGSWGAAAGGAGSGGPARPSGGGAVGDPTGGSPGGGGYGPAGAGAASPGGTAPAGGTRGAARAGGAGATIPGGTAGAGGAGGAAGARGIGAGGTGGAGPRGARSGGAGAAAAGGAVRAGGTAGAGGAGAGGTGDVGAAGPGGARPKGTGAIGAGGGAGAGGAEGATGAPGTGGARGTTGDRGPGVAEASGATGAGGGGGAVGAASAGGFGAGGAGAAGAGGAGAASTALCRPFFYPQPQSSLPPPDSVLRQVLSLPSSTGLPLPFLCSSTE